MGRDIPVLSPTMLGEATGGSSGSHGLQIPLAQGPSPTQCWWWQEPLLYGRARAGPSHGDCPFREQACEQGMRAREGNNEEAEKESETQGCKVTYLSPTQWVGEPGPEPVAPNHDPQSVTKPGS